MSFIAILKETVWTVYECKSTRKELMSLVAWK